MKNDTKKLLVEHKNLIDVILNNSFLIDQIIEVINLIHDCFKQDKKVLICGNGGSAADAQHIAAEFVNRFLIERKALNAEALTVNTSSLTAISNDYDFDKVFSRQIEAKGKKDDILIAISTTGNSKNIIRAIETAKELKMITIGFTGNNEINKLKDISDYCLCVPSKLTPRIQEMHILIFHIICEFVEKRLFAKEVN
ncbi:MAG: D-sedoheptulose 7-phosphate isomerase [Actinobacteria bacterium]|nr:D-sedoheptulose 7-phosphate isomerase [Actinomycetota bacterium]